jgi:hypothetical protein
VLAATACGLMISGGFLFVRFGNENFEQVRPADVHAFDAMLREAPNTMINVVWLADPQDDAGYFPMMPWGTRKMEHFDYSAVRAPADPSDLSDIVKALLDRPGGYFITTRGNEAYNHFNYGLPLSYADRMRTALAQSSQLRPVAVSDEAVVYALRTPPPGAAPKPARAPHFGVRHTTWTPIGLCAIPLLIVVLVAREVLRIRIRPNERWRLQPLTVWSTFLVIVLGVVIIERFLTLG